MRLLNDLEKLYCERIVTGANQKKNNMSLIVEPDLADVLVRIHRKKGVPSVDVNFDNSNVVRTTDSKTANSTWTSRIEDPNRLRSVYLNLITAVNLIKLLEKDGYVLTYQDDEIPEDVAFGRGKVDFGTMGLFYDMSDDDLIKDIKRYAVRDLIVTEEFRRFVHEGFIARDEQRYKRQIRTALIALIVASFAALSNFGFNLHTKFSKKETQISQNQIDTLVLSIEKLAKIEQQANLKLDSLYRQLMSPGKQVLRTRENRVARPVDK